MLTVSLILVSLCSANMKILQLNCSGFTKELNIQLSRYVEDKKAEILCLQETFAKDRQTTFKNWRPYLKPSADGYGGVAIFVSPTVKSAPCDSLMDSNLEAVWARIQVAGKEAILGSVYIRPGQTNKVDILQNKITSIKDPLIITGDLNGHSKLWDKDYSQGKSDPARKMGIKIEKMVVQESLRLHNTGQSTFMHRRDGSLWALDLTFSRNVTADSRWHSDQHSSLNTDHFPTILHIEECQRSFRKSKWDTKNAPWDAWCEAIDRAASSIMDDDAYHTKNPSQKCDIVQNLIKDKANDIIPKKTICEHSKAFFTEKLSTLSKEFREAKKKFKVRSDEQNLVALNSARDRLNDEYIKEREAFWKEICENTLSSNLWNTVNKITQKQKHLVIQPLRNTDGTYEFRDEVIAERLKSAHVTKDNIDTSNFDEDWYKDINSQVDQIIDSENQSLVRERETGHGQTHPYNRDITETDVEKVIDMLKVNSSPGPDGILPVMLKKGKEGLVPIITDLIQSCWKNGTVPKQWKMDNRVFIPKGDIDPHTEKSLRGLSLNPIIGKCMERSVVLNMVCWLESNFKIPEEHYAYRKHRGVVQALLTLICSIKKGFSNNEYTVAAMVDLHAAFDTIWRKGLIFRLHEMGIRGRLLLYINSFLSDRKSKLLVNSHESWVETCLGVPQGAIISPILFVCYISTMTANIPNSLGFADDLTLWITHTSPDIACKS